jgi:hypothetical protein
MVNSDLENRFADTFFGALKCPVGSRHADAHLWLGHVSHENILAVPSSRAEQPTHLMLATSANPGNTNNEALIN